MTPLGRPSQRVQVFSLGTPATGTPKDRRRYSVRWRVDGRDRMRSFKTKAQAERFRSTLQVDGTAGTGFDNETGLPAESVPIVETVHRTAVELKSPMLQRMGRPLGTWS